MEINREEIQKIAMEAENLQRMQKAIKDQIVALSMASLEASVTMNSLESLKGGENSLVSLGSGVFSHGTVGNVDLVLVDIGGGVYGEFPKAKAIELLKKRIEDTKTVTAKLEADLHKIESSLVELENRARKFIQ
ncbi:MAG: prefoldin subunit alpha [Candidatus Micrarchaeia archaeon]